ncbi:hypothetical protein Back2_13690 [Nocardioides baekrokdamisoli]|uniref:Phosphotyrosine protein phosphatase I domain-containing protein n=1 Tax=Nocardioides baekrokdamisoli TaxID=1804624 RepID=A0A3G9IFH1_9ACTN|nr:low molecular weight phosphatase family protein [Nocardioides baekrokdamisoli]BBH17082.1 hypothetical protein Back2_13690 [Nocardioides baekrokdamisoli]
MLSRKTLVAGQPRRGADDAAVQILVVCTGNICRSPYVAALLQRALPDARVTSAGTAAMVGRQPVVPVADVLADLGAGTSAPARQLRRSMVRRADVIVAMTHTQRATVVQIVPKSGARTFTLKELARTAAHLTPPGDDLRTSLTALLARTALDVGASARDHDDDLDDPYGGPPEGYVRMMSEADLAVGAIVAALRAETLR